MPLVRVSNGGTASAYAKNVVWSGMRASGTLTISLTDYEDYKNITASNIKAGITSASCYANWSSIGISIGISSYNPTTGSLVLFASNSVSSEWSATANIVVCVIPT